MTMFPADHGQNLRSNKDSCYNIYGGSSCRQGGGGYNSSEYEDSYLMRLGGGGGSDLMAEDESRTEISSNNNEEGGSSSKDNNNQENEEEDGGWLQLSLGSGGGGGQSSQQQQRQQISRLIELDLLSGTSSTTGGETSSSSQQLMMTMTPLTLTSPTPPPYPHPHLIQHQQLGFQVPDFGGPFLVTTGTAAAANTSSSLYPRGGGDSSSVPGAMSFSTHQFHQHMAFRPYPLSTMTSTTLINPLSSEQQRRLHLHMMGNNEAGGGGGGGRMDMRVVDPPPRPHSGLWFMLQPSLNQTKEPYLPQLPKSYLRIRDGRTSTVGLLIKYLVNKLKLDSEFELEITCKGQQLLPFMTLHHVRDNIWRNPRNDAVFSRTSANVDDHLMVLKYGRIA